MTLRDRLEDDIREAMRQRSQARLDALRFLKFAVQAVEKERGQALDDQAMVEVVAKQVNDRRESIRAFEQGLTKRPCRQGGGRPQRIGGIPAAPTH